MISRAIALVASKGGVGKTTLCANLAVRATKESKRVALFDADPQQALARWWQLRGEPDNPKLIAPADLQDIASADVPAEIAKLKAKGWEYIFVDSPPAVMHIVKNGVLIPVPASPIDVEFINPTVEICEAPWQAVGFVPEAKGERASWADILAEYRRGRAYRGDPDYSSDEFGRLLRVICEKARIPTEIDGNHIYCLNRRPMTRKAR